LGLEPDKNTLLSIIWFKRDLRLDDNRGLFEALKGRHPVLPVFIFDTGILKRLEDKRDARVEFILNEIRSIKKVLENSGSSLLLYSGSAEEVFKAIISEYNIAEVYCNSDHEPYGISRDRKIRDMMEKKGIGFHSTWDHMILPPGSIVKNDGSPYTVFTPYKNKLLQNIDKQTTSTFDSLPLISRFFNINPLPGITLEELGFLPSDAIIPSKDVPEDRITEYDKKRDFPELQGTSRLGIHLRFGTISIRRLLRYALPLSNTFVNELIWREFFMMIMWHFPRVVDKAFKPKYDNIIWRNDENEFSAWCNGNTGYPIVDAGMTELNKTGYMHNRVRMITASFLTKHLLIDWRWGEAYFAGKLLDFELSSNNGGWQWATGSGCDAAPYFRIFNPELQAKKFDPSNIYINKWISYKIAEQYYKPIVPHKVARERVLSAFKKALM